MALEPGAVLPKDMNPRQWAHWARQGLTGESVGTSQIQDGSVTLVKLATSVQTSISLADTSIQPADLGTAAYVNTGTSGASVPLLNGANTHASAKCTLFAIGSAAPAATQAANADTSGATLGQLETEVNEIKAVLRTFGIIA